MPNLHQLILNSAWAGLNLQAADGAMPPGHNGPYYDVETPIRNTSHWLIIFAKAYDISGEKEYHRAALRAIQYLLSDKARPGAATFWHRQNPQKDACNGLIGQAWTLEALAIAASSFGMVELMDLAQEVFLLHPFEEDLGLWRRVEVDGQFLSIDPTFNHQLWFAAVGSLLVPQSTSEVALRVNRFVDRLHHHLDIYPSGLIRHPLTINTSGFNKIINWLKRLKQAILLHNQLIYKSIGYHAFNLYALALLNQQCASHSIWDSPKFKAIWCYALSEAYKNGLEDNKFGYPYNPPGLEMAFALEIFADNARREQERWIAEQIRRCYDFKAHLMCLSTDDPNTLAARLYEVTRLPDLMIMFE